MDDDGVEITDVNDDDFLEQKVQVRNQDMSSVAVVVGEFVSQYGWALLLTTALVYLIIQQLSKRRSSLWDSRQPPPSQRDAVLVARNQEAMEAARRKMQEELDAKAVLFREKQKQQEEERRRQKIEVWENMQQGKSSKGHKLSESTFNCRPRPLRKPVHQQLYSNPRRTRDLFAVQTTILSVEMEEVRAPGDRGEEGRLLEDEVKEGQGDL
ncbi:uncharacterized protein LOC142887434 isoform X1 [Nelusetta ayraudi]|uniref:uncharacterized protein LOC142887434 isoform X1 n=1 Tax=Nelusetta ayraudi TaxID=303726 RepID=UPI003F6E830E